jgi:hypothetical protein
MNKVDYLMKRRVGLSTQVFRTNKMLWRDFSPEEKQEEVL